jgi:hypothetical protein
VETEANISRRWTRLRDMTGTINGEMQSISTLGRIHIITVVATIILFSHLQGSRLEHRGSLCQPSIPFLHLHLLCITSSPAHVWICCCLRESYLPHSSCSHFFLAKGVIYACFHIGGLSAYTNTAAKELHVRKVQKRLKIDYQSPTRFPLTMSQDLSSIMNAVMWIQVLVAIIFVGARMYTRHFIIHNIGWDDTFMLVNLVRVFYLQIPLLP